MSVERKEFIYIITDHNKMKDSIYKIGRWTRTQKELLSRYSTNNIGSVLLFSYPTSCSPIIEDALLYDLLEKRIEGEWVKADLKELIYNIIEIVDEFEKVTESVYEDEKIQDIRNELKISDSVTDDEIRKSINNLTCESSLNPNTTFTKFIKEKCILSDSENEGSTTLWNNYKQWCEKEELKCLGRNTFLASLANKFEKETINGKVHYIGIKLNS